MMKIMKASAGSGKTYSLSETYRKLILQDPDLYHYRHILAVTFTNKATAEMKSRILRDLHRDAQSNPHAREVLSAILNDYGAFSVSTIDRFFQRVLRSFSREIGQFADYQVEINRSELIEEAALSVLDKLTEDSKDILDWIYSSTMRSLADGQKPNIENIVKEAAKSLMSVEYRHLAEVSGVDEEELYSKERLQRLRKACDEVEKAFVAGAKEFGLPVEPGTRMDYPKPKALKNDPAMARFIEDNYPMYYTAFAIRSGLDGLGFVREFRDEFNNLQQERNVLCLDESSEILRDIINGSEAPFVYEKMGVRYEDFLLDEFQDTSAIQWDNFRPLLQESNSKGGSNLVVGDVKQSIYRWRGSEWKLLGCGVQKLFPDAEIKTLDCNWRSCRTIVEFNNRFFKAAAEYFGLSDIYSDVEQKPMTKDPQSGYVRVTFTGDEDEAVFNSVNDALNAGAKRSEIAVLVRNNEHGQRLATLLLARGIPVISDESLTLSSSQTVKSVVALMKSYLKPDDTLNSAITERLGVKLPQSYGSLVDFCTELIASIAERYPDMVAGEKPFIQTFMDDVLTWSSAYGTNLRGYLDHLDIGKISISLPEGADAVRVLTIHKSKGLEFPHVIFPYAEKVELFNPGNHWCRIDPSQHQGMDPVFGGIYSVMVSSKTADSYFADAYENERKDQLVDNMNVFYVALTRAVNSMHIIARTCPKTFMENLKKGKNPEPKDFGQLLYAHIAGLATASNDFSCGTPYDFNLKAREEKSPGERWEGIFSVEPMGGRLKPSTDSLDFFTEDISGGTLRIKGGSSARLGGITLHAIISRVHTLSDVDSAVDDAVMEGSLEPEAADEVKALISARVAAHPEWFPTEGATVLNERSIIAADGNERRPDRVLISGDTVTIIDFKFGEEHSPGYLRQVSEYAELYRKLGYKVKAGVIWYVKEDICDTI